jgi:hypothetical protein
LHTFSPGYFCYYSMTPPKVPRVNGAISSV